MKQSFYRQASCNLRETGLMTARSISRIVLFVLIGGSAFAQTAMQADNPSIEVILDRVAAIHGAAGVFAVAGYRMGERALHDLEAHRGSFALDVTHRTPLQVQYSCVADGWQAATGVSAGKLNLHIVEVPAKDTETLIRNRQTGKALVFRLRKEFLAKYLNAPQGRQKDAGRQVAGLPDDQIFTVSVESHR
jgi:formylmethanofuran dehydrogenase subunit E